MSSGTLVRVTASACPRSAQDATQRYWQQVGKTLLVSTVPLSGFYKASYTGLDSLQAFISSYDVIAARLVHAGLDNAAYMNNVLQPLKS